MRFDEILSAYKSGQLSTRDLHAWFEDKTREPRPVSEGQKGLWALQRISPESCAYNVPICVRLGTEADPSAFTSACRFVLKQHPLLASVFVERDGQPVRMPVPTRDVPVVIEELPQNDDTTLRAAVSERILRFFRLDREAPVRFHLLRRS
jgi:polyketide synthase PksN